MHVTQPSVRLVGRRVGPHRRRPRPWTQPGSSRVRATLQGVDDDSDQPEVPAGLTIDELEAIESQGEGTDLDVTRSLSAMAKSESLRRIAESIRGPQLPRGAFDNFKPAPFSTSGTAAAAAAAAMSIRDMASVSDDIMRAKWEAEAQEHKAVVALPDLLDGVADILRQQHQAAIAEAVRASGEERARHRQNQVIGVAAMVPTGATIPDEPAARAILAVGLGLVAWGVLAVIGWIGRKPRRD